MSDANVWAQLLERLKVDIDPEEYRRWFSTSSYASDSGDVITVWVPSAADGRQISQNHMPSARIQRAGMVARLAVAVCVWLGVATGARAQQPITFSKDVAPILYEHCVTCHRPGEIAPFSLLTYEEARPQARAVARATADRTMSSLNPGSIVTSTKRSRP